MTTDQDDMYSLPALIRDATARRNAEPGPIIGQLLPAPLAAIVAEYAYVDPCLLEAVHGCDINFWTNVTRKDGRVERVSFLLYAGGSDKTTVSTGDRWHTSVAHADMCRFLIDGVVPSETDDIADADVMSEAGRRLHDHIVANARARDAGDRKT